MGLISRCPYFNEVLYLIVFHVIWRHGESEEAFHMGGMNIASAYKVPTPELSAAEASVRISCPAAGRSQSSRATMGNGVGPHSFNSKLPDAARYKTT